MTDATQQTAFARGAESQTAELRGECPRATVNVLDAVSMARDMTRNALVNEILGEFAAKKLHESMLIQKITQGNPELSDVIGGGK